MPERKTISRVTVYADSSLEDVLIEQFQRAGARGYTITDCRGKGDHETVDDPLGADTNARIRIELLVRPEVADRILHYLADDQFQSRALTACSESVQVVMDKPF